EERDNDDDEQDDDEAQDDDDDEGNDLDDEEEVSPLPMSAPTFTPSTIATITTTQQAPLPFTTALSTLLQDLPNFGSLFGFDHQLKTLEVKFFKFSQTNQFAGAVSAIPGIVKRYMDQRMNKAVKVPVQIQSDRLCDEAQADNDEFLKTFNENMQKIIKTSYAIAAYLSEMELKKILIEKMEGNKDKEPSAGLDQGSKRRREGKNPKSASAPTEKAIRSTGKSTQGSKSQQTSASKSATAEEAMQTTFEMEEPSHPEFETGADDQPIVQSSQHPEWFSQQQKPPTSDRDWNKTLSATHGSI
nr:hypothetical protein [Tanacetum cinerariifolium]